MKSLALIFLLLPFHFLPAQWSEFAPGNTNGTVIDLQWFNGELYAGGFFTTINGDNASSVAKWNGSSWEDVGGGLTDGVHSMEVIDSTLYATRYEFQVDSNWVYYLDNGSWNKLGSGFYLSGANAGQFYLPHIFDVRPYNGDLVACGEFDENNGNPMNGIAKWDGSAWSTMGSGLTTPFFGQVINPHQILVHNGLLYVCGNFQQAGGVQVNGVAVWDGSTWAALGDGFNSTVYALGVYNGELYAGGDFSQSGSTPVGTVAKWDGTNWISPGFSFDYTSTSGYLFVHTIKEVAGKLYLMGGFDRLVPDGQSPLVVGSVVSYDGQNFDLMGGGADNDVESITEYQGNVLVGGFFATVGNGVSASKLALYDSLATGTGSISNVHALTAYPNPASERFSVNGLEEGMEYALLDLQGKTVAKGSYSGSISVHGLERGLYILRLGKGTSTRTLKIAKF